LHPLGQAEVGQARLIVGVDEHVRGLEVAVQDALLVRIVDGLGNRLHVTRRALGGQRFLADERGKIPALHVVHREVGLAVLLARLVDADDVGMLQPRRRLHLRAKSQRLFPAGELARENHLHCDKPVQLSLPRLEDDAHSAPRDFL
jgi:hypothetical protein